MSEALRKAVFLDRDGVVNIFPGPDQFVLSWEMFEFMPGIAAQIRRLREHGFFLVLVTNQSGVGRGLMTHESLTDIHDRMQAELGTDALDAIYYCHHHPEDGCLCRKPSPHMILTACEKYKLDPKQSFVIGDSGRDIDMGRAAGCTTILCREKLPIRENMKPEHRPDRMFQRLEQAVDFILQG